MKSTTCQAARSSTVQENRSYIADRNYQSVVTGRYISVYFLLGHFLVINGLGSGKLKDFTRTVNLMHEQVSATSKAAKASPTFTLALHMFHHSFVFYFQQSTSIGAVSRDMNRFRLFRALEHLKFKYYVLPTPNANVKQTYLVKEDVILSTLESEQLQRRRTNFCSPLWSLYNWFVRCRFMCC